MPLPRKTYGRKRSEKAEDENQKENIEKKPVRESKLQAMLKIQKDNEVNLSPNTTVKAIESVDPFDLLRASPMKQEVPFKPLSFWGKKLKELDTKMHETGKEKKKACQLYELSESDVSTSSSESKRSKKRKKKQVKVKRRTQKKINPIASQFNLKNVIKVMHEKQKKEPLKQKEGSMLREKLVLKEKYTENDNKFSFDNVTSFGLTSTPGLKENINVVDGSNFNFLSPIIGSPGHSNTQLENTIKEMTINKKSTLLSPLKTSPQNEKFITPKRPRKQVDNNVIITRSRSRVSSRERFSESEFFQTVDFNSVETIDIDVHPLQMSLDSLLESESIEPSPALDDNEFSQVHVSELSDLHGLRPTGDKFYYMEDEEIMPFIKNCKSDDDNEVVNDGYHSGRRTDFKNITHLNVINNEYANSKSDGAQMSSEQTFTYYDYSVPRESYYVATRRHWNSFNNVIQYDDSTYLHENVDNCLSHKSAYHASLGLDTPDSEDMFQDEVLRGIFQKENQQTHGSFLSTHDNYASVIDETLLAKSNLYSLDINVSVDKTLVVDFNAGNDSSIFLSSSEDYCTVLNKNSFAAPRENTSPHFIARKSKFESPKGENPAEQTMSVNLTFGNDFEFPKPVFESTVCESPCKNQTPAPWQTFFESNRSLASEPSECLDFSLKLKPGKQWMRSASVLKKALNGTLATESRLRGKRCQTFMAEVLEMQEDIQMSSRHSCQPSTAVSSLTVALSKLTVSMRSISNRTVRILERAPSSQDEYSFRNVFETLPISASIHGVSKTKSETTAPCEKKIVPMSARDLVLSRCNQEAPLPFENYFNKTTLKKCKKIGEGVFGEVFMCGSTRVIKVIPIEGQELVNGEPQKTFQEILSEIVIAMELSKLRNGEKMQTSGFSELKRCWCVVGSYPQHLLDLWNDFDFYEGSKNDSPIMFKSDQLYIVLEFANGGKDLESFVFNSAEQSLFIFFQTAYTLAVAEKVLEFEHRDLHWGNILIAPTKEKYFKVVIDGEEHKVPTKGVKVTIIDFTLSRITFDGCSIYNDLSVDPTLFTSTGDYQFDMYRMMRDEVENNWELFRPKTNIFWLHYVADKMVEMVRYKNVGTKIHNSSIARLTQLKSALLSYSNSRELIAKENFY